MPIEYFLCRRNIPRSADSAFLRDCTFNESTAKGRTCPIFSLKQIVDMYNDTDGAYDDLAEQVYICMCIHD